MTLSPEAEAYLAKARHALEVAEKLRLGRDFSDSAAKSYYAMFYAAQALLKAHGIEVVKHSAVASAVGYHFADTGPFDPKFSQYIHERPSGRGWGYCSSMLPASAASRLS